MGKWVPRPDTRGAHPIFHIKFESEVKYFVENLCQSLRKR